MANVPFNFTRKRKQPDPSNRPAPLDMTAVLTVVSNKLRVTLPQQVSADGLPHYAATGGAHSGTAYPTAITQVSSTVFDLTYAAVVAAANVITIPSRDPCFRGRDGAYVGPQIKTLS